MRYGREVEEEDRMRREGRRREKEEEEGREWEEMKGVLAYQLLCRRSGGLLH